MPLLNRNTLHKLFSRGSRPTEKHFSDLIDASANQVDDGFNVSPEHGLCLSPLEENKQVLSIFRSSKDRDPALTWSLDPFPHVNGLSVAEKVDAKQLFFKQGGNIGIHTHTPRFPLHVAGYVGMQGRSGTYAEGTVPADSYYHTIAAGLDGLQGFEIQASVVKGGTDNAKRTRRPRSAFVHAIALAAFEGRGSHNKIRCMHSGWLWDRIYLRWVGDIHNYRLQIKTLTNYGREEKTKGNPIMITYKVTQLWSDEVTIDQR